MWQALRLLAHLKSCGETIGSVKGSWRSFCWVIRDVFQRVQEIHTLKIVLRKTFTEWTALSWSISDHHGMSLPAHSAADVFLDLPGTAPDIICTPRQICKCLGLRTV